MKKLMLAITTICFMTFCSSPVGPNNENKAQRLISEYLKRNLNDPESYESIEFSSIDSLKSIIFYTDEYSHYDKYSKDKSNNLQMRLAYSKLLVQLASQPNPPKGFSLTHTYRAKNGFGAKMLEKKKFIFNDRIDSIISVLDVKN
ncbi:hypothetical protein [Sphingobacterium thalpophilum]|uniref:hypothetical protein n=1 Tax=Sphingobacterium thalpophilum TaxID=259 RepID=UPI0031E02243